MKFVLLFCSRIYFLLHLFPLNPFLQCFFCFYRIDHLSLPPSPPPPQFAHDDDRLQQWFSTFFDSRHSSLVLEQFGGTPIYNLPVNRCQVQKLVAPLELFTAPKGSVAPRLRTTDLQQRVAALELSLLSNIVGNRKKRFKCFFYIHLKLCL